MWKRIRSSVKGRDVLYDADGKAFWRCSRCHTVLDRKTVTLDHVIPLRRGWGRCLSHEDNLQIVCSECNRDKEIYEDSRSMIDF